MNETVCWCFVKWYLMRSRVIVLILFCSCRLGKWCFLSRNPINLTQIQFIHLNSINGSGSNSEMLQCCWGWPRHAVSSYPESFFIILSLLHLPLMIFTSPLHRWHFNLIGSSYSDKLSTSCRLSVASVSS